jgi:hypothetical protein
MHKQYSLTYSINDLRSKINETIVKEESEKSTRRKLRDGYDEFLKPYANFITTAVTLTLKTRTKITLTDKSNPESQKHSFWVSLDDDKLCSSMRYLTARLNHYCFGNLTRHKNKRDDAKLLLLFFVEGDGIYKRKHFHLAIGNIPGKHQPDIEKIIKVAWQECDFANRKNDVRSTHNAFGWLHYETKEVEYGNPDVFNVVHSCIPRFIKEIV